MELSVEFSTAKGEEKSLVAWRDRLSEEKSAFGGVINKLGVEGVVGSATEYQICTDINGEIEGCLKVTREMLCILNPRERQYQWYTPGDREKFLKDIGFPGAHHARMGEMVEMRGLLDELKRMSGEVCEVDGYSSVH